MFDGGYKNLSGEHWWIDTTEDQCARRKTLFSATLSVTDVTLTGLGSEMGLHCGYSKQETSIVRPHNLSL